MRIVAVTVSLGGLQLALPGASPRPPRETLEGFLEAGSEGYKKEGPKYFRPMSSRLRPKATGSFASGGRHSALQYSTRCGAAHMGISQNYVSDMERGRVEVGAEILLRIAREFGRTIEWLLTGEERP